MIKMLGGVFIILSLLGCQSDEVEDKRPVVTRVIDGDTLIVSPNGIERRIRLIGVDAKEMKTPTRDCAERAKRDVEDIALGKHVSLVSGPRDTDRYGRWLRYVYVGETDIGLKLIDDGLADARYDSRDGYAKHPKEKMYHDADEHYPNVC